MKKNSGQSLLEFVLLIPILLLLILGTTEIVFMGRTYLAVLDISVAAARLGANGIANYDNNDIYQFALDKMNIEGPAPEGLIDVIITRARLKNGVSVSDYSVERMKGSSQSTLFDPSYLVGKINAGDPSIGIVAVEILYDHPFLFSGTVFLPNSITIRAHSIQGVP